MFKLEKENIGVLYGLLSAILWGSFAILVNRATRQITPLTFAASSIIVACITSFIYSLSKGTLKELHNKKSYFPILMVSLFIIVIPYSLFFIGASKTSGINTALLGLSQLIFTVLITPFFGEKTNLYKIFGAMGVFMGSAFILYNGFFDINIGDILIIFSTFTFPFGNFYAKKALNHVSPSTILLIRFMIGAILLSALALIFESNTNQIQSIISLWPIILFNGIVLLVISKIFYYESLKRLDITKAITLTMTAPISSLFILIIFLNEEINLYKWLGILFMAIGIYFTITQKSTDSQLTKYA